MCQKIKIHIDPHRVTYNIMFLYKIKYFIIFTAVNNKIFNKLIILEKYRICHIDEQIVRKKTLDCQSNFVTSVLFYPNVTVTVTTPHSCCILLIL
jgi:hypothetical protein